MSGPLVSFSGPHGDEQKRGGGGAAFLLIYSTSMDYVQWHVSDILGTSLGTDEHRMSAKAG